MEFLIVGIRVHLTETRPPLVFVGVVCQMTTLMVMV
jgi:hypothetical protein